MNYKVMSDEERLIALIRRNEELSPITSKGFDTVAQLDRYRDRNVNLFNEYYNNRSEISRLEWLLLSPEEKQTNLTNRLLSYDRRSLGQKLSDRLLGWDVFMNDANTHLQNLECHYNKQDGSTTPMDENLYLLEKSILLQHREALEDRIEKIHFEMLTEPEKAERLQNDTTLQNKLQRWKQEEEDRY